MPEQGIIRCRFCQWKTTPYVTRNGKRKNGFFKLQDHVLLYHLEEYFKMIRIIDPEGTYKLEREIAKECRWL